MIHTIQQFFPELIAITDGTKQQIPRPKNRIKRKTHYSGKKKKHTVQNQITINLDGIIIHKSIHSHGSHHDYKIYKSKHPVLSEELLSESWGYDKSFVFKIGPKLMEIIRIGIRNKKTVIISVKEKTPKNKITELDRILQVECGFVNTKKNEWKKDMPSILNMNRRREENVGSIMPEQTFEVCNKCGITAITTQTVSELIGYRKTNDKIITQPNCHKCRTKLSKNPTKKTGLNKKKMIKSSLMIGNSQTKLD